VPVACAGDRVVAIIEQSSRKRDKIEKSFHATHEQKVETKNLDSAFSSIPSASQRRLQPAQTSVGERSCV
jgi:hypothetical protein